MLERRGDTILFHPRFLELADHYAFEPRPVAPRRGNEKGRVERAIRYLRTSFFPLRHNWSLEDLNQAAVEWTVNLADHRRWPRDRRRTVEQAYHEERPLLLPVPDEPFPAHEVVETRVRRSPYVRFDTNKYSVPHEHVRRAVTIFADIERVRIFERHQLLAEHTRCWDKQKTVENPAHVRELVQAKSHARRHRLQDRLSRAVPEAEKLLVALARRQRYISPAVERLVLMLEHYGPEKLRRAVLEAVEQGSYHPDSVQLILDRHDLRGAPPLPVRLPDRDDVKNLVVKPHDLDGYDPETDDEEEPT